MIVPFAAGGGNDIVARIVSEKLAAIWKVGVIVENRSGAGGNAGAEAVTNATPDGYTLLFSTQGPLAVNRSLYTRMRYNPDDFTPISLVASSANVLAASSRTNWKSLKELIDFAKANPNKVTYASSGSGTTAHLAAIAAAWSGPLGSKENSFGRVRERYRAQGPDAARSGYQCYDARAEEGGHRELYDGLS
jgi:tripartite-type tricarboxylate transporter receptor subunit TctC